MKAGRFGWEEEERICLFGQTEFSVRVGQGRSGIRARLQGWQCALHQAVLCFRSQVLLIHTGELIGPGAMVNNRTALAIRNKLGSVLSVSQWQQGRSRPLVINGCTVNFISLTPYLPVDHDLLPL